MSSVPELLAAIRRANRPAPPEHSIFLRLTTTGCVLSAIGACAAEGELTVPVSLFAVVAVVAGNLFSYVRRDRPVPWLKAVLAGVAVAAFLWFFFSVSAAVQQQNIAAVEGPLAALFAWIQVIHSFDVPSRRDLGFSMAGSVTLMAVAGAQATDSAFGLYVVVWATFGLLGLAGMWASVCRARIRPVHVAMVGMAVIVLGGFVLVLLPPPRASSSVVFPSSLGSDLPLATPAALVGAGSHGAEPAQAASASGATRVGGYLGFAGPLDTAIRGALGNEVVLRVRADQPSFWVAETFDHWDGQSWTETEPSRGSSDWHVLNSGSPFFLPFSNGDTGSGQTDVQTFYMVAPGANIVLHAEEATEVWFPARRLYIDQEGNLRASTTMGAGSIYTVESTVSTPTTKELLEVPTSGPGTQLPATQLALYTQLPHPYPRVDALARRVTAGQSTVYAKVTALEHWIATHTRYTTDIPPLARGQDTVDEFLFGNRRGYCEQISTALAVMLRSLGIPAREATGYVPGPYNPITDLYDIEAKDAHAWVQVWFPRYGWVNFDPTAQVPLANPSPADAVSHDLLGALHRVPSIPTGSSAAAAVLLLAAWRWRRRRPRTWAAAMTAELERTARRTGSPPTQHETLLDLGERIDRFTGGPGSEGRQLADLAEGTTFGRPGAPLGRGSERDALARARRLRRAVGRSRRAGWLRRGPFTKSPPPAPAPKTPETAGAAGRT